MNDFDASFSYSPILVVLSVIVAIQAGYVGISLGLLVPSAFANRRRLLIAASAMTLAVGIWSMHFIGMLALTTSVPINYAVLPTLLSFLVCGLVTGVAIYVASLRSQHLLVAAALLMGIGITAMHYVGMIAVHSVVHLSHNPAYALASLAIASAASGLALWLAFSADRRPPLFLCALVFGCAVSGMHYTAMAGTTLHPAEVQAVAANSVISRDILATIVSVVAFSLSGIFMLGLIPTEPRDGASGPAWRPGDAAADIPLNEPEAVAASDPADAAMAETAAGSTGAKMGASLGEPLPIEKNGSRFSIAASEIASVHSNAHYCYIFNGRDDLFCPLSISEIAARLPEADFFRTHRSYIVNLASVVRVKKAGDAAVAELDTPVRRTVPVSRARTTALRQAHAAYRAADEARRVDA